MGGSGCSLQSGSDLAFCPPPSPPLFSSTPPSSPASPPCPCCISRAGAVRPNPEASGGPGGGVGGGRGALPVPGPGPCLQGLAISSANDHRSLHPLPVLWVSITLHLLSGHSHLYLLPVALACRPLLFSTAPRPGLLQPQPLKRWEFSILGR